uniref:Uncharacterized protein 14 n=1 Tax=Halisarca dujardinii TaxID=2583056 RepID=A0AA96S1R1_HALDU|nr:uncharacterized protein 14 [Halisarca dujardinii]
MGSICSCRRRADAKEQRPPSSPPGGIRFAEPIPMPESPPPTGMIYLTYQELPFTAEELRVALMTGPFRPRGRGEGADATVSKLALKSKPFRPRQVYRSRLG